MIIIDLNGRLIKGKTAKDVVKKIWILGFDNAINKKEYMNNVGERIKELHNETIETKNYRKFLEDLRDLHILTLLEMEEATNG